MKRKFLFMVICAGIGFIYLYMFLLPNNPGALSMLSIVVLG